MTPFHFNTTPSLVVGAGAIARIGEIAAARLGPRILLVTDAGLVKAGLVAPVLTTLAAAGLAVTVFDQIVADPPEAVVLACAAAGQQAGVTGVLGLGGGSSLDVAKLAALLNAADQPLSEAYGVGLAKGPRLPLILVPTTAGTGSEVTPIAIVTTGASEKKGVVSPILMPDVALLDPDLTLGLPPAVTAATGVDAMVHAIEAITSVSANNNPVSQALAREALRLMGGSIRTAVHHGQDRAARSAMLLGSLLAGQAFANSPVAAVHALAYPLGGHFHIPHGLSNALVLPEVVRFNAGAAGEAYAEISAILFPDSAGEEPALRVTKLADRFLTLARDLGLPTRLRDAGVPESAIDLLATDAMKQTRLLVNNPRPVTLADATAIYRAAW